MSMKLLLAVDGSRYTRRMLTYIVSNELLFRPFYDYVLFNVQPGEGNRYDVAADNALLEESNQFLQAHGFTPLCVTRQGEPAKELVEAAKQFQSNMLVMGCRGQSAIESMVLGSVTAAVLAHSHVPVLVVR
ncbi:MAG: hypothetical protein CVU36_17480 [Betaproteobacteria bacterium HGW-Betaproteobacteria-9]|jgi:nucleotide-binding universal stress UspA family protein|nr:universal stress protein [Hydrogenophaga sp.]PKO28336.1 MAG: hypothetical protein CVU36_17480 [Betaproteobacteria bacterium HGW-Betaproteobacteria-9]